MSDICFLCSLASNLDNWLEINFRKRRWMAVAEVKETCPWMKEALDILIRRQIQL
ncbi:uncharacterized protein DS421_19g641540 [Arachis hypogaea]|uniref:Uncharacterized protein n=1 Tax=Arachis hypogaea TaxID=3818 RepID=A0A6B9V405_ARAHY|nr:uncharacterized protein DS421_19g641540 [Arachis hypogaea]